MFWMYELLIEVFISVASIKLIKWMTGHNQNNYIANKYIRFSMISQSFSNDIL
jgi:hypothetical protein